MTRGHSFITFAKFSGFWTPSPPCSLFGLNHKTKFTQPRLLHSLLGTLPPTPLCERNKWIAPNIASLTQPFPHIHSCVGVSRPPSQSSCCTALVNAVARRRNKARGGGEAMEGVYCFWNSHFGRGREANISLFL